MDTIIIAGVVAYYMNRSLQQIEEKELREERAKARKNSTRKKQGPEQFVIVPPFISTVVDRDRMAKSPFCALFAKRTQLFTEFFNDGRSVSCRLAMAPEYDSMADFTAESWLDSDVNSPDDQPGHREKAFSGSAMVRLQPNPDNIHSFFSIDMSAQQLASGRVVASYFDLKRKLGIFAHAPILRVPGAMDGYPQDLSVGIRHSTRGLCLGLRAHPHGQGALSGWILTRKPAYSAGVEWKASVAGLEDIKLAAVFTSRKEPGGVLVDSHPRSIASDLAYSQSRVAPTYEVGIEAKQGSTGQEFALSYFHHLVAQRRVKNPMEDDLAVGINNYIDIAVQLFHRPLDAGGPRSGIRWGASWQINKNTMVKGRIDGNSVAGACVFKSWWNPASTVAISYQHNIEQQSGQIGMSLVLENFGDILFGKTAQDRRVRAENLRMPVNK